MVMFIEKHPRYVFNIVYIVPLSSSPHVRISSHSVTGTTPLQACLTVLPVMFPMVLHIKITSVSWPTTSSPFFIISLLNLIHQSLHDPDCRHIVSIIQYRILPVVTLGASLAKLSDNLYFPSFFNEIIAELKILTLLVNVRLFGSI